MYGRIYTGSFIRERGALKAIVEIEHKNTVDSAAVRKVYEDENGHYVIVHKEKVYLYPFSESNLKVMHVRNGVEYLIEC